MKKLLLIPVFLIHFFGFSQSYFGVKLNGTYPVNYTSTELSRKIGGEIGINYGKAIKGQAYLEAGLLFDVYGRSDFEKYNTYTMKSENIYYTKISLLVPVLLKYKFGNCRFSVKTGVVLSGRSLITFTNYSGIDAEEPNQYNDGIHRFGLDYTLGMSYKLFEKLNIDINYSTPFSSHVNYGIVSLGINYLLCNN